MNDNLKRFEELVGESKKRKEEYFNRPFRKEYELFQGYIQDLIEGVFMSKGDMPYKLKVPQDKLELINKEAKAFHKYLGKEGEPLHYSEDVRLLFFNTITIVINKGSDNYVFVRKGRIGRNLQ